jgi:putative transposase
VSAYVDSHRDRLGVEPICRTLDVSASAYYQRATGERSDREVEDERLVEVIKDTHKRNYFAYGYRRMWKALQRAGEHAPRCRVQRLMAEHGIQGAKRRGKPWRTTRPDPAALRSPDLVQRDFTADRPNALWVCDFTYLRCWEGVLYFSFVIDVFSRMIVGWQLAANMRDTLVLDALRMALGLREHGADVQLVNHSDAGSQYTSGDYTQTLSDHLVLGSIGTVGDAYDNALAESFVDSYKTELISDRVWRSRSELELATVEWVAWFNHERLHSSLGDIPPVEYEALHAPQPVAAGVDDRDPVDEPQTPADERATHRAPTIAGVDLAAHSPVASVSAPAARNGVPLRPRQQRSRDERPPAGLSDLRVRDILTHNNIKMNKPTTPKPT